MAGVTFIKNNQTTTMKNTIFIAVLASLLCAQCTNKKDSFTIQNGRIGPVTSKTSIQELDSIFANDSIVPLSNIKDALGTQGEVEIFDKDGSKLLRLSPDDERSPNAVINTVRIYDARYKTDKGLSIKSTFKDLKDNYEISGIQTSIDAVVLFIKDSDIFITIDKKQLPENLRYNPSITIETSQIPDNATFKYFMLAWKYE
jgi:hypothetical protein